MLSTKLRSTTEFLLLARMQADEIILKAEAIDTLIDTLGQASDTVLAYENMQQNLAGVELKPASSATVIQFPIVARRTAQLPSGGV